MTLPLRAFNYLAGEADLQYFFPGALDGSLLPQGLPGVVVPRSKPRVGMELMDGGGDLALACRTRKGSAKCNDAFLLLIAKRLLWETGVVWHTGEWSEYLQPGLGWVGAAPERQRWKLELWETEFGVGEPRQEGPGGNVGDQEGLVGASAGAAWPALRPYPQPALPVTSSLVPVQKVASEAKNTAAAATFSWLASMRPRAGGTRGKGESRGAPARPPPPDTTHPAPTPTWARVPSDCSSGGQG